MKVIILELVVIFTFLASISGAMSININYSNQNIENWLSNSSVHYITINMPQRPSYYFRFYENGTSMYDVYYPYYYYESNFNYSNSSTGTAFFLGKTVYPQSFLNNMKDTIFCDGNYTGNSTVYRFFITLCELKNETFIANGTLLSKYNVSESELNEIEPNATNNSINTEINNYLSSLAVLTTPKDIFSKLFYSTYANYSNVCTTPSNASTDIILLTPSTNQNKFSIKYVSCLGNSTDLSLPYFIDYYKYINSLDYFLLTTKYDNPQFLYYSLLYGIKNSQIFPNYEGPELIQNNIALLGVYPGIIPSGYEAEKQLNYSQLLIPINYIKNQNTTLLEKNGINISSGTYKNITLDVAVQNKINDYSYYNISTSESPFYGTLSSGPIEYADSCNGGIGFGSATQQEEENIKNQFYNIMFSNRLYPENYYQNIKNGSYYGPSIIQATPSNINFDINNITYGAKYINGSIAYENSTHTNFTNQTLLEFNISVNSIKNPIALKQLFASLESKYSYTMNFYEFNTYFDQPQFNITHGQYQKTITYTEDNKTYSKTITCYTSSVSTKQSYNSSKQFFTSKTFDYTTNQTSYINVSTNMSAMSMFKTNNNGLPTSLNYSFVLYRSSTPSKPSFSYVTIPPGTDFQIYSPNETLLESFDASFLNTTAVENGNITSKVYMFGPTWVYPDIYSEATAYYPTYLTIADDNEYKSVYSTYKSGLTYTGDGGIFSSFQGLSGMETMILEGASTLASYHFGLINKTQLFNSAPFQFLQNEHMTEEYYLDGCPYTKIGNVCVIPQTSYVLTPNQTMFEKDYNLLNPLLYSQNMYFYYIEPSQELCTKVGLWQTALSHVPTASGYVANWTPCTSGNYSGINYILVDSQQLNFNTTWENFTPTTKKLFYNILENSSTYNRTYYGEAGSSSGPSIGGLSGINFNGNYSVIYPESYSSPETEPLTEYNKHIYNFSTPEATLTIENSGASFNISKDYNELLLDECKLDFCFSTTLYPTKVYTMLFYQSSYEGNNTYRISVYPNAYQTFLYPLNSSINENVEVSFTNGGYTLVSSKSGQTKANLNVGSTFYIKYNPNSTTTSLTASGNTIYVTAPTFSQYSIMFNFTNPETLGQNSNYTFLIPKQSLTVNLSFGKKEGVVYWLSIIVILIILYLLYKTKFFEPFKEHIKRKFRGEY